MRVTELAIKKPAAMSMIIMFFIVMGLAGYYFIGSDLFPKTNIPFVTVVTTYPGAGAREIETQILDPIEEAVASVSGLKRTMSTASEGIAVSILEFSMSTDADMAAMDTQKAVDAILYKLPEEAKKPVIQKYHMNTQPIMTVVLTGNHPLPELNRLAEEKVKDRLQPLPGVGRVSLAGGREREIQIDVNRYAMEGYGLSINQVVKRLTIENINIPAGNLKQTHTDYTVRTLGEFTSLQEIKDLLIPFRGGTVRLGDIATVRDGYTENKEQVKLNGKEALGIIIQKQSDASIVDTTAVIKKELDQIRSNLPKGVELVVASDSSIFIHQSLNETKRSLLEGVLMCGLVLAFFLREWRSVITVMLAIPTSIVSTFLMMYLAGFSFNLVSLMGLTLCVGILVDDSIVVLENIHRHRQMGKSPVQAALDGRYEIGMAAIAITLQDVVVFMPIAFMSGMVGQFFRQFGLTVVFATLFSLFVSFTLTPMLAARLGKRNLKPFKINKTDRIKSIINGLSAPGKYFLEKYQQLLEWSLSHRRWVFGAVLLVLTASASLIPLGLIGSEFMTTPDQSRFNISVELPPGSPLGKTGEVTGEIESRLLSLPETKHIFTRVGSTADIFTGNGSHLAEMEIILKDKDQRKRSVWDITSQVREWKKDFPGIKMIVTEAPVPGAGEEGPPVQIQITGPDEVKLAELAGRVQEIVQNTPGAVDVRSTWKSGGQPEIQVEVDRLKAGTNYLSAAEIGQVVRASVDGEIACKYREEGNEYDIRVRLDKVNLNNISDISDIKVGNTLGQTIPLGDVAAIKPGTGPTNINHQNRQRLITISANLKDRPLGDVTSDINGSIARSVKMPAGYHMEYFGTQKDMEESFRDLILALILSVILVYMILVILYESFLTPLIRLLSLPCGMIGALWALYITGCTFNLMSMIGLVMLDGLAAKSGTLLIDYTNTLLKRGMSLREALFTACRTRLRPIAMTACTMISGVLPTALALAEGSELRRSMAVVLIGGMITSALITPILIPTAYSAMHDLKIMLKRLRPGKPQQAGEKNEEYL